MGSRTGAGPVGQTGKCLFGTGAGAAALDTCWVLIVSSAMGDDKVTMPEEERCGGIGLGRATVVMVLLIILLNYVMIEAELS